MKTLGRHLIAEYYGCEAEILDDPPAVMEHMKEAARICGATVVGEASHRFSPCGVSGTVLIAESHLSVHTWPRQRYVAVDIFTCGGLDPRPGFEYLGEALGASSLRMQEILRGLPDEIDEHDLILPEDVRVLTEMGEPRRLTDILRRTEVSHGTRQEDSRADPADQGVASRGSDRAPTPHSDS